MRGRHSRLLVRYVPLAAALSGPECELRQWPWRRAETAPAGMTTQPVPDLVAEAVSARLFARSEPLRAPLSAGPQCAGDPPEADLPMSRPVSM